ncbi:hypothetical protein ACIBSV_10420 [Embleya sp. NPDC050154]|uniref:hypothetical protein n=1 Tax=unclassified Embleya TaxID=2699296 RepID=UPI0037A7CAF8
MDITNRTVTARRAAGSRWAFEVRWTVTLTPSEASSGTLFQDAYRMWEWDVSDHDALTNWSTSDPFDPPSTTVKRIARLNMPADALDTESGEEEIRAQIGVRNVSAGGPWLIDRFTPIVHISP